MRSIAQWRRRSQSSLTTWWTSPPYAPTLHGLPAAERADTHPKANIDHSERVRCTGSRMVTTKRRAAGSAAEAWMRQSGGFWQSSRV